VEVVSPEADKHVLATCDLGITIADFLLADTGTLGLTSSAQKPKAVSLLPLVHLAIITSSNWRTSLSEALVEFKHSPHLTLISGPSRTSDIELILTLGVHGPKHLVVWYLEES
jgi:L-lactate dehydrogenase complex protein LldG